jgi:hypothetical protein
MLLVPESSCMCRMSQHPWAICAEAALSQRFIVVKFAVLTLVILYQLNLKEFLCIIFIIRLVPGWYQFPYSLNYVTFLCIGYTGQECYLSIVTNHSWSFWYLSDILFCVKVNFVCLGESFHPWNQLQFIMWEGQKKISFYKTTKFQHK